MKDSFKESTEKEAKKYLTEDFNKTVKRTIYLYLKTDMKDYGNGYFEPILLFFCWCDYLGALYTGEAGDRKSTYRSKEFIRDILGEINKKYKCVTGELMKSYRHRLVHSYQPTNFFVTKGKTENHLKTIDEKLHISIEQLLEDILSGIELFAQNLDPDTNNESKGSLYAFNKARRDVLLLCFLS